MELTNDLLLCRQKQPIVDEEKLGMIPQNIPVESRPKEFVGLAIGAPMWHVGKSITDQCFSATQDNRVGVG